MNPQFDDIDRDILEKRAALFMAREGARVGDWVEMPDGTVRRFTHDWDDGLQTTYMWADGRLEMGSFYLNPRGYVGYSGSLDDAIPRGRLVDTGKTQPAPVWFFHHDEMRAHNGVNAELMCRVFKVTTKEGEANG